MTPTTKEQVKFVLQEPVPVTSKGRKVLCWVLLPECLVVMMLLMLWWWCGDRNVFIFSVASNWAVLRMVEKELFSSDFRLFILNFVVNSVCMHRDAEILCFVAIAERVLLLIEMFLQRWVQHPSSIRVITGSWARRVHVVLYTIL